MERCHTSTSRVGPRKGWGCLVDILNQICSVRDVPSYNLTMQINVQKSKIYIIISPWKKKLDITNGVTLKLVSHNCSVRCQFI